MKKIFIIALLFVCNQVRAQLVPDSNYSSTIYSVKLFQQNNQESLPIINLNSSDLLELHFDDIDGGYTKNYYYTYTLCNADWTENDISQFDYIKGFTQNRITQARPSSICTTKYVHYQATLPERNCIPTKSGNYLLKVFLNSDQENIVFTKRMYVVESKAAVGLQIKQPFDFDKEKTHHKLVMYVNTKAIPNILNPNQSIKVALLQNNRYDNAKTSLQPSFIREDVLEYSDEREMMFEAGKEYRWADLRSFRFMSDRLLRRDDSHTPIDIYVKPDTARVRERYLFWKDINGYYDVLTTEFVNNWWQTDYANVHFVYKPENWQPYFGQSIYILGEFTNNKLLPENKMIYNATQGIYEKTLYLKQGYYNYCYVTKDAKHTDAIASNIFTEGNYWETENNYTAFVYYRAFGARYDELVGTITVNSRLGRVNGF